MAGVSTDHPYYGVEQTKTVRKVKHHSRDFKSNKAPSGKMIVHHVIFDDGFAGEFFQISETLKRKNGLTVADGETICFIPKQPANLDDLDVLKMCPEAGTNNTEKQENDEIDDPGSKNSQPIQDPVKVFGTAIAFSVAYAKDIANEKYKGRDVTVEEYLNFIGPMATGLKKIMMDNL